MAKIFITGSADGLGLLAARQLIRGGHEVVLHARDQQRADEALKSAPGAKGVLSGDLADIKQTRALADKANSMGVFDAVIHNAGVYQTDRRQLLLVNLLAPYILTALMEIPRRLIYLSSDMHFSGHKRFSHGPSYADTKLQVLMLAKAFARNNPDVYSNAVDPGWVPTKMGGAGAPDDLTKGYETQVWLSVSTEPEAMLSGRYFHHKAPAPYSPLADDIAAQEKLLLESQKWTGVRLPGS